MPYKAPWPHVRIWNRAARDYMTLKASEGSGISAAEECDGALKDFLQSAWRRNHISREKVCDVMHFVAPVNGSLQHLPLSVLSRLPGHRISATRSVDGASVPSPSGVGINGYSRESRGTRKARSSRTARGGGFHGEPKSDISFVKKFRKLCTQSARSRDRNRMHPIHLHLVASPNTESCRHDRKR